MKIKRSENPYVLDRIDNGQKTVALTRKNATFIEAVVELDSRYGKVKIGDFFENMLNGSDFEECLINVVTEIDKTNSTRLESGENARKEMVNRILSLCSNVDELKNELLKEFSVNNKEHILWKLTDKIKAKKKDGHRYNLSFATKFCSYASIHLNLGDLYSKYDGVVSRFLPTYSEIYLNEKTAKGHFLVKQNKRNLDDILNLYATYSDCINSILNVLEKDDIKISRNEFDHIIWYCSK